MTSAPWARPFVGRLEEQWIDSEALTGNPLGDPHRRPLLVQTPPGYEEQPERRFPTIYLLQGLTGQVDMWRNRKAFRPTVPEALDALLGDGSTPPAIVVYVDAWTRLGGSQFVDSPGTGRYHTYLCDELIAFVDGAYRTLPDREHRAVLGHSSGGYGAMVTAMLRPDLFGAFATHAGDALFEVSLLPEVSSAVRALRDRYDGSYEAFWTDHAARSGRPRPADGELLNLYCMAACYSTDADGTIRLPFDPATGRHDAEIWARWLANDPVRMAPLRAEALRSMRGIWIDAGRSDDFNLDLGAQAFRDELERIGIDDTIVHYELYEGTHSNVEWRYPLSIRWLLDRMPA